MWQQPRKSKRNTNNWGQPENHRVSKGDILLASWQRQRYQWNLINSTSTSASRSQLKTLTPTIPSLYLSVSQSLRQLRHLDSRPTILLNSTCENCASNANGNETKREPPKNFILRRKRKKSLRLQIVEIWGCCVRGCCHMIWISGHLGVRVKKKQEGL